MAMPQPALRVRPLPRSVPPCRALTRNPSIHSGETIENLMSDGRLDLVESLRNRVGEMLRRAGRMMDHMRGTRPRMPPLMLVMTMTLSAQDLWVATSPEPAYLACSIGETMALATASGDSMRRSSRACAVVCSGR
jgi:hypothetical protein